MNKNHRSLPVFWCRPSPPLLCVLQIKMSQVKQVGLLAAGCQPWNKDVCAASEDRFAYCATLAIYVYQLDHRYNEFKLRAIMSEHKKTITAISWCPHNPEVFASASADNLLIIWNVAEQKIVARLDNTKGIPASLSWCWNAGDGVAFVSHRGPLYLWAISGLDAGVTIHKEAHSFLSDICLFRWHPVKKGKVVFGHTDGSLSIFQPGSKNQKHVLRPESLEGTDEEDPVTALEWDPLSTDYLLVANLHNGIRMVDSEGLTCVTTFSFPSSAASVQCLAWVPSAPGMFITGDSQVGVLRIWNVSRSTPLDNFKLKKTGFHALHVLNSPPAKKSLSSISLTKNHYTSSTSEAVPPPTLSQNQAFSLPPGHAVCCFVDGGVGLYDMGAKKWVFLRDLGHVETIFDCKFKPDDPNLLATASFDGTIKVWDINTLTAVNTSPGNEGVVYSLSWAPEYYIPSSPPDRAMVPGATPLLCGKVSRDIKQELDKLSSEVRVKKLRWFSECFSPPGGSHNLWDLVSVINGQDDSLLPQSYSKGVMHMKHLVRFKTSEAQELTIVKMSKFGGGIGAPSKEERLRDAAEIHLRLGQIQRYCELMVELGEWDKALSVAPGVSIKYWKKLMQRRADQLMQEENHDVIPYCIATGDVRKLVNFFTARGQLNEALLVAQGACEGNIHVPQTAVINHTTTTDSDDIQAYDGLLHCACKELAEWYFQDGRAVLAACCHLAVDNTELAMASLIRGNELELAVCVGLVLGESANQATHYVLELLARKFMTAPTCFPSVGSRDLAADLLQMIPDNEVLLAKLCAFYPGSSSEIDQIHEKCGLPSLEECQGLAESAVSEGDIFNAVKYYLMSPEPEAALLVGIAHVKEQLSDSDWTVDSVHPILDLLGYIRTDRLILAKFTEARSELLILSGYIGALLAIRRQYSSIVPALYEYTSQLMKRREVSVPLQIEQLSVELEAWMACTQSLINSRGPDEAPYTPPSEAQKAEHARLLDRLQEEPLRGLEGPDYVTGSNLPSHSDVQVSCFTGLRIQGPVFFLEDGKSAISLNDALMWAKVNPFSPLGTGVRLNPF
nr:WD repeat-containing protein 17-like [Oncorhynchus nerka]